MSHQDVLTFIVELDKLKSVNRAIKNVETNRYENSAEHSWQVAVFALTMKPYTEGEIDLLRVLKMLLLHDVVEIDTGDKFAYSSTHEDHENELKAAKRLFSMLPDPQYQDYLNIWEEFEAKQTLDAKFAAAMDRVIPIILNLHNKGQSWIAHGIKKQQVLDKNAIVGEVAPSLWEYIKTQLDRAVQKGYLLP